MAHGHLLHRRLFVVEADADGTLTLRQPTIFLDLVPTPGEVQPPDLSCYATRSPAEKEIEQALVESALQPLLAEVSAERQREVETIARHLELSLNTIIDRVQVQFGELMEAKERGSTEARPGRPSQAVRGSPRRAQRPP